MATKISSRSLSSLVIGSLLVLSLPAAAADRPGLRQSQGKAPAAQPSAIVRAVVKGIVLTNPTPPTTRQEITNPLPISQYTPNQGSACDPNG